MNTRGSAVKALVLRLSPSEPGFDFRCMSHWWRQKEHPAKIARVH